MKKIRISPYMKWGIIVGLVVIGIISAYKIVTISRLEEVVTEEQVNGTYQIQSSAVYQVTLKENEIYDEKVREEGELYITNFIDQMQVAFGIEMSSSIDAKMEGNYTVLAEVANYTSQGGEKVDYWTKNYIMMSDKSFKQEGQSFEVDATINVPYWQYAEFVKQMQEATKLGGSNEVRVRLQGTVTLETAYGKREQALSQAVIIPLEGNSIAISKEAGGNVEGQFADTITTTVPGDRSGIVPYSVGAILSVLGMIGILVLSESPTEEDLYKKRVRALFNTYGSRMVAVDQISALERLTHFRVDSIEDLIKIADEIESPVIYERTVGKDILKVKGFYVIEETKVYSYQLERTKVA